MSAESFTAYYAHSRPDHPPEVELTPRDCAEHDEECAVFLAADGDGALYVVARASHIIVMSPDYADFRAWRALPDWEAVFQSPGYKGDADVDRKVLQLPPDADM